jgi:hypothetical protein
VQFRLVEKDLGHYSTLSKLAEREDPSNMDERADKLSDLI